MAELGGFETVRFRARKVKSGHRIGVCRPGTFAIGSPQQG